MAYRKFLFVLLVPALAGGCGGPAARTDPLAGSRSTPAAGGPAQPSGQPATAATGGPTSPGRPASPETGQPTSRSIGGSTPPPGQPATPGDPLPEVGLTGNGSAAWTLQQRGPRDTDLLLQVGGLACRRVVGAHVTETAAAVTIAILVGPTRPGPCIDVDRTETVLVRAAGPIGSRQIRHAPLLP